LTTNPRGSPSNFHDDPDILARPEPDVKQTFFSKPLQECLARVEFTFLRYGRSP